MYDCKIELKNPTNACRLTRSPTHPCSPPHGVHFVACHHHSPQPIPQLGSISCEEIGIMTWIVGPAILTRPTSPRHQPQPTPPHHLTSPLLSHHIIILSIAHTHARIKREREGETRTRSRSWPSPNPMFSDGKTEGERERERVGGRIGDLLYRRLGRGLIKSSGCAWRLCDRGESIISTWEGPCERHCLGEPVSARRHRSPRSKHAERERQQNPKRSTHAAQCACENSKNCKDRFGRQAPRLAHCDTRTWSIYETCQSFNAQRD